MGHHSLDQVLIWLPYIEDATALAFCRHAEVQYTHRGELRRQDSAHSEVAAGWPTWRCSFK